MTDDAERQRVNPWQPMRKSIDLKHLGKFLEELAECGAAISRCLIQGINEREPDTGKLNKEWLEQEIADVIANYRLVIAHFDLDIDKISDRALSKQHKLKVWHNMLGEDDV